MGLETATYIHELDSSNPVGASDPKGQGDDHLKLIKSTLQNTFPNIEGEVTITDEELSQLHDKLAAITQAFGQLAICEIAFLKCNSAGVIQRSHNVDSVSVGGTGQRTVTFDSSLPALGFIVGNVVGQAGFLQINNPVTTGNVFVQVWGFSGSVLTGINGEFALIGVFPKFTIDL